MSARPFLVAVTSVLLLAPLAQAEQMRGVVSEVNGARKQLVIEGRGIGKRGKIFTFTMATDAAVLLGNDRGKLEDLASGQSVVIQFDTKDGQRIAIKVQGPATPAAKRPAAQAAENVLTGVLRRVALTEREIVVAVVGADGKEVYTSLPVAANAKIVRDDKEIKFDDLKEEERAAVRMEVRDGKKVAVDIRVGKAAVAVAVAADPNAPSTVTKLRMALRIADQLLEMVERQQEKPKEPEKK